MIKFFLGVGWIPVAYVFVYGALLVWKDWRQGLFLSKVKRILLAIDIPRNNEQSPKAVEQIFTYVAGAHSDPNMYEEWWEGQVQLTFSFEIVSIEGYTQFLIHTPEKFRNLVESAVYSVYPDAEITEVNDYTAGFPTDFPNDEIEIWGNEFIQSASKYLPFKTYSNFVEKDFGKPDITFKDPIASLMDLCASMRKGEYLWFQVIVKPISGDWAKGAELEMKKMLNEKVPAKKPGFVDAFMGHGFGFMSALVEQAIGLNFNPIAKEEKKDEPFKMMNLKPHEKEKIEAMHKKMNKLAHEAKVRAIYVAKKEVMNKPKGANGLVGYMKQFSDNNLNGLKPDNKVTGTKTEYFMRESRLRERKRKIMRAYISRSAWRGRLPGIFNIEELATLWHFPVDTAVKVPLIQKVSGRKAEPPMSLPLMDETKATAEYEDIFNETAFSNGQQTPPAPARGSSSAKPAAEKRGTPPGNLPGFMDADEAPPAKQGGAPDNLPFA